MPFSYRLLDFGKGRKLEQFSGLLLDRPSPPAEPFPMREPVSLWNQAAGTFRRSEGLKGIWRWKTSPAPQSWTLETNHFSLILKPTEVGHLGVFAEQEPNWEWIYERTKFFLAQRPAFRVLNLFAYTGGSTLAAAAAMREAGKTSADAENFSVSHVDSAKNIVQWARENAETSGLADAPVRWIGEDAMKFTRRELKRGKKYDAVILDPPSYGHGTKGEVWKLEKDLPELLDLCAELIADSPAFVLLTAHSPGLDGRGMARLLREHFPRPGRCDFYPMELKTTSGRVLPSGEAARIDFS
ncbi:MAG: class I SAM-dependent methyltransferase [Thermoguttaceae bacterium]|nr:class I SAM-dependent methyltransferase [Thermoguttaceae bacterium]MBR0192714.1 class I SAM-dependent methyltransferase [Thermoguttaceae bacterium]